MKLDLPIPSNPTNRSNATPKPDSQEAAMLKGIEGRRLLIDGDYQSPP